MITDPARNRYLQGFGLGLIIGALASSGSNSLLIFLVVLGAAFMIIGVALSFYEKKNDK